jgi:hypothetical protein
MEVIMFTANPFVPLAEFISPAVMQGYLVLMTLAVAAGTVFDMLHKQSAKFFAQEWQASQTHAKRQLGGGEIASLAARTLLKEVATSGEFCKPARRLSHLLMSYGFVIYLLTTIVMVCVYPAATTPTPALLPLLWHLGALMAAVGGYWFFFLLRVDVAHEGHSPFRLVRADLFIVTLLASVSFALVWSFVQTTHNVMASWVFFALYIFFSTLLFVSVPRSKFAHMFYKPVVAFQRRVEEANGSSKLPAAATGGERCPPSHT